MKIVVVGAGDLGSQVAAALAAGGNAVTLVDSQEQRLPDAGQDPSGIGVVVGDACDPSVLEAAAAPSADVLVAVTGRDEDNLVVALLAKRRCRVPQVVARVNDPDNLWLFGESWGVDVAVSAAATTVSLIEEATRSVATVDLMRLRRAGVELLETSLTASSRAVGRTLDDLGLPPGLLVSAVVREGEPLPPAAAGTLAAGDQLLLLSSAPDQAEVEAIFQGSASTPS